jgi:hypothetical protein
METKDLYPWQKKIISGFKKGEMSLFATGHRTGKSTLTQQTIDRLIRDLNSRPIEKLVLAERLYCGAHFYTVEPVGGNWLDMETWCIKTFGSSADVWDFKMDSVGRWYANDRKFWFRKERDRTMFIMRWSS